MLLAAALFAAPQAAHAVIQGGCVNDVSGLANVCTANDLTFLAVGLGTQDDGCVSATDTVSIFLEAIVRNTTAKTRYDVGMYFATDGGTGLTGSCAREILKPVDTTVGATACPPLDLSSGSGPFYNQDGDACGDLIDEGTIAGCDLDGDGLRDPAVLDLTQAVTFPCQDLPIGAPTGFVNIGTCATWGNQNNQVDTDGDAACSSEAEAVPGTKSKCRCSQIDTTIPAPNLALSCTCASPTTVRPGFPVSCTVSYANNIACTPDPATPERFQCGTAGFVRFDVDDGLSGAPSGTFSVTSAGRGTTAGTPTDIQWTPAALSGTSGIVAQSESDSLDFVYTVSPSAPDGPISLTTTTIWANDAGFTDPRVQPLTTTCSLTVDATWATVSSFHAYEDAGRVVTEWETASEVGTVGFDLYRLDPATGRYRRVNDHLLAAVEQAPGGVYRFVDENAPADGGPLTYKVVELDRRGSRRTYGPFAVHVAARPAGAKPVELPSRFAATPHAPSPRALRALKQQAAESALSRRSAAARQAGGASGSPVALVAAVGEAGLYRLGSDEIAGVLGGSAVDVEGWIRSGQLLLTSGGQDVAWTPGEGDRSILFYGQPTTDPLAAANAYRLAVGHGSTMRGLSGPRPAAAEGASFVDTVHFEKDLLPRPEAVTDPQQDFWFWDVLLAGHPIFGQRSLDLDVHDPAPGAGTARLTVHLQGFSTTTPGGDNVAAIAFGGQPLGEIRWHGAVPYDASLDLPQGLLNDGTDTVEVTSHAGLFFVDGFDLTYRRLERAVGDRLDVRGQEATTFTISGFTRPDILVFDLTDPRAPRRVDALTVDQGGDGLYRASFRAAAGTPYLAATGEAAEAPLSLRADTPSSLHSETNRGAYVVIAPASLLPAARALADYRRSTGLETQVVDVADIYDEFSAGVATPEAIRDFLAYAYTHWELPPHYAVLAGKGSFDYKDHLGLGGDLVPPLLVGTSNGLVAADNRFGDVVGGDGIPEIAVGRIPALTSAELSAYVDKVIAYEGSAAAAWNHRVLMVADDPDNAGDFRTASDDLAGLLPAGYEASKIYLGAPYDLAQARQRIEDDIDQGAVVLNYLGHGGLDRLAAEGLLTTADLPQLGNAGRLPVVTALTCNIGYFAFPGFSSLGEELVLDPTGGAAAVWGPSGLSVNDQAVRLGQDAFGRLFGGGQRVLGDVVTGSLRAFATAGGDPELLAVYNLFGDPGLEIK